MLRGCQHYWLGSERYLVAMILGDVLVRALEWRARRFDDPVDRLQFLRRNVSGFTKSTFRAGVRRHWFVIGVTFAILILSVWYWTLSRYVAAASDKGAAAASPAGRTRNPVRQAAGKIWLVQNTGQFELYSNGLRIEEQYATSTGPRQYLAFARRDVMDDVNSRAGPASVASSYASSFASGAQWRTEPAGIVYHTTESHLAPFEEEQNQSLRRAGEGLLEYVKRRRAYHFVIDRFGRVFRVVRESDYANHAGNSVWEDAAWIYLNLNQSFFGVAFEARSTPSGSEPAVNEAQIYAGRILTEMLRARYGIAASNCVAHAQVSVNPSNFGLGYHRDWAANLPFARLGLPDNYELAVPSVRLFAFEPPDTLMEAGDSSLTRGLEASQGELRADAEARGLTVERYRKQLQERYRDAIRALRGKGAYQEYN